MWHYCKSPFRVLQDPQGHHHKIYLTNLPADAEGTGDQAALS